jgi:hypothetical protein
MFGAHPDEARRPAGAAEQVRGQDVDARLAEAAAT